MIHLFARLPGVGEKTAQRYALHLALGQQNAAEELGQALATLARGLRPCRQCGNIAEVDNDDGNGADANSPICDICRDPRRNGALLCIVARVQDLLAIERSGAMRGRYFVLGKLLSPLDGITASELPMEQLQSRLEGVEEVLLATPPSVDGEATALFLSRELTPRGVRVTRIASGVPHGGDLEFADQVTLGRAIEGRKSLD